jgi:hypothetical protein
MTGERHGKGMVCVNPPLNEQNTFLPGGRDSVVGIATR